MNRGGVPAFTRAEAKRVKAVRRAKAENKLNAALNALKKQMIADAEYAIEHDLDAEDVADGYDTQDYREFVVELITAAIETSNAVRP